MSKYRDEFIRLLEKRAQVRKEIDAIRQEIFRLDKEDMQCLRDIDKVFDDIHSEDNKLYDKLLIDGTNECVARFAYLRGLIEINRRMGYSNPVERIIITEKPLML